MYMYRAAKKYKWTGEVKPKAIDQPFNEQVELLYSVWVCAFVVYSNIPRGKYCMFSTRRIFRELTYQQHETVKQNWN